MTPIGDRGRGRPGRGRSTTSGGRSKPPSSSTRAVLGPDATAGLDDFSHIEVVFVFDRVGADEITGGARHPRGRADWPEVGILAQRAKGRPNRVGVTRVRARVGRRLCGCACEGLDAIDGTPVVDVKPYMSDFGPRGPVREPAWAGELMRDYW